MSKDTDAEKYIEFIEELLLEDEMHRFRRTGRRIRVADIPNTEIGTQAIANLFDSWNAEWNRNPLAELNQYADALTRFMHRGEGSGVG